MVYIFTKTLLVSETTAGRIKDITEPGNYLDVDPFAYGLKGPSSIVPLPDGRIYVCETSGNRIVDISMGGESSDNIPFIDGLKRPYSLTYLDNNLEVVERESVSSNRVLKINPDTGSKNVLIKNIPAVPMPGLEGILPQSAFPDDWEYEWSMFSSCAGWKTKIRAEDGNEFSVSSSSALGQIVKDPESESDYMDIVKNGHLIASGLDWKGGMIQHPTNKMLYVTQPHKGTILEVDPFDSRDYRFQAPIIQGLNMPTCVRFSPDGNSLYVCSAPTGSIWKLSGFQA
ncbi:DNA-binding beta-propeller fold protein YncE [Virgibacillus natechei]|uniref:DNA-binding beta-propeller fold protein YncE n=1 Tax=Virgibacillus natechei TaxID=1216297 RepID=A0ABS4IH97_9BACI|nr:hypothetical protein [Virgibacillus natechei]MBP1970317.1 DNA-binding beta-propeller fold protein YncE [Virgibacillus natechei]UZD13144.1 hypothetical protein OLD84_00770 [Virgibacillus natechei]